MQYNQWIPFVHISLVYWLLPELLKYLLPRSVVVVPDIANVIVLDSVCCCSPLSSVVIVNFGLILPSIFVMTCYVYTTLSGKIFVCCLRAFFVFRGEVGSVRNFQICEHEVPVVYVPVLLIDEVTLFFVFTSFRYLEARIRK